MMQNMQTKYLFLLAFILGGLCMIGITLYNPSSNNLSSFKSNRRLEKETKIFQTPSSSSQSCLDYIQILEKESIVDMMKKDIKDLTDKNLYFFMLNGENNGIAVEFTSHQSSCLSYLLKEVAIVLEVDISWISNGIMLKDQLGRSIDSFQILHNLRIAHLLFDMETWIFPGIQKGYQYHLPFNQTQQMRLTTLSLDPLVYIIEEVPILASYPQTYNQSLLHMKQIQGWNEYDVYDYNSTITEMVDTFHVSHVSNVQRVKVQPLSSFITMQNHPSSLSYLQQDDILQAYSTWKQQMIDRIKEFSNLLPKSYQDLEGIYHPQHRMFQDNLIRLFQTSHYYYNLLSKDSQKWIETNLIHQSPNLLVSLIQQQPSLLPLILHEWEKHSNTSFLFYSWQEQSIFFSKKIKTGQGLYRRWLIHENMIETPQRFYLFIQNIFHTYSTSTLYYLTPYVSLKQWQKMIVKDYLQAIQSSSFGLIELGIKTWTLKHKPTTQDKPFNVFEYVQQYPTAELASILSLPSSSPSSSSVTLKFMKTQLTYQFNSKQQILIYHLDRHGRMNFQSQFSIASNDIYKKQKESIELLRIQLLHYPISFIMSNEDQIDSSSHIEKDYL